MSLARAEAGGGVTAADRRIRHRLGDRLYHWLMAASVLALLGTSLLPILGVKFAWVAPHWIAGLVLTAALLYHVPRALIWQDWRSMAIGRRDLNDGWRLIRWIFGAGVEPEKPGKYELLQKIYHHTAALVTLVAVVTGVLMLTKIDTPLWKRNPYWMSDQTWGVVYVLHGLATLGLITLIMVHVYYALRPENLWFTRSMIRGWITEGEYRTHHDPDRWNADRGPDPRLADERRDRVGGGDATG